MEVTSYKEKYERKKYAYDSLLKDYNELAERKKPKVPQKVTEEDKEKLRRFMEGFGGDL